MLAQLDDMFADDELVEMRDSLTDTFGRWVSESQPDNDTGGTEDTA